MYYTGGCRVMYYIREINRGVPPGLGGTFNFGGSGGSRECINHCKGSQNPSSKQWRRRDLFRGGRPGHLKAIRRPPPGGGPLGEGPRTVAKFHFSNDAKYFKNETSFQKYQYFSCPKTLFFLRKIRKIEHIWQEFMIFFEQLFENFQFLWNL